VHIDLPPVSGHNCPDYRKPKAAPRMRCCISAAMKAIEELRQVFWQNANA
jgi:hypothetical protein